MVKKIQRKSDKKYLSSLENNTWVDDIKDACEFTQKEVIEAMDELLKTYSREDLLQYTNAWKNKAS
jgi:hypothetical protein